MVYVLTFMLYDFPTDDNYCYYSHSYIYIFVFTIIIYYILIFTLYLLIIKKKNALKYYHYEYTHSYIMQFKLPSSFQSTFSATARKIDYYGIAEAWD